MHRCSPGWIAALGLALGSGAVRAEEAKPAAPPAPDPAAVAAAKPSAVAQGLTVAIEYTLTLDDGSTAGTNVGGEPMELKLGEHQLPPALEEAMVGMQVSESRKVTLEPAKGFGEPDPKLLQEVDAAAIPEEARFAGAQLATQDDQGNPHFARVHEVRADKIVVDLNHPLAGKALHFDVKVLSIE